MLFIYNVCALNYTNWGHIPMCTASDLFRPWKYHSEVDGSVIRTVPCPALAGTIIKVPSQYNAPPPPSSLLCEIKNLQIRMDSCKIGAPMIKIPQRGAVTLWKVLAP